MALQEHPREDLLNEATAYSRRILVDLTDASAVPPGKRCELFAGVRNHGGWSLYFDQDPVLQFVSRWELRRLFWNSRRFAVQAGQWIEMIRDRVGGRVEFDKQPLAPVQTQQILVDCQRRLDRASELLTAGEFRLLGCIPVGDDQLLLELREVVSQRLLADSFDTQVDDHVAG